MLAEPGRFSLVPKTPPWQDLLAISRRQQPEISTRRIYRASRSTDIGYDLARVPLVVRAPPLLMLALAKRAQAAKWCCL